MDIASVFTFFLVVIGKKCKHPRGTLRAEKETGKRDKETVTAGKQETEWEEQLLSFQQ